jgi:hypothetical protein
MLAAMHGQKVMGLSASRWVFVVVGLCTSLILLLTAFFLKDTRKSDAEVRALHLIRGFTAV